MTTFKEDFEKEYEEDLPTVRTTKNDIVISWYYIAYRDYLDNKITFDDWELIKEGIDRWKKANK